MAKENIIDIRKSGPLGYRALQMANQSNYEIQEEDYLKDLDWSYMPEYRASIEATSPTEHTPEELGLGSDFGTSIFDPDVYTTDELYNYQDVRAKNQPFPLKWAAGLGKGISLAGTTFLDGTVGLLYGTGLALTEAGQDIFGKGGDREGFSGTLSYLWDNEISNGFAAWNEYLEEALPNYRTQAENENEWWENLGTANFWADGVLKNMGFMVGAFYSGNAWTGALKGAHVLKSAMGARTVGSVLSAVNEARISANHNTADFKKTETAKLEDAYKPLVAEIMSMPDEFIEISDNSGNIKWVNKKQIALDKLKREYNEELKDIEHRANKMGVIDFALESVMLSLNNFYTTGKLLAGGYQRAQQKALGNMTTWQSFKQGVKGAGKKILKEESEDVASVISREGGEYIAKKLTKKQMLGNVLKNAALEGNEEMAQAFIGGFAGNTQAYDSPDAYYLALTDPTAERNTNTLIGSATQAWIDSYGNGSRYEEFAIGAISSLFGIPSFGKVNNSSPETWIGHGKSVGVRGGLFGEFAKSNFLNQKADEYVNYMNKYMKHIKEDARHFVQSDHFTNIMDGWAQEKDAFEYKNYEDNNDFAAIAMFAETGRLQDLKDLVNEDFENINDEELDKISKFTRTQEEIDKLKVEGHYDNENNLTDLGRETLRKELIDKRNKTLDGIDAYEKSVAKVRAIAHDALNESQVNELAWLDWKLGRFNERFKDIKEDNSVLFTALSNSLLNFRDAIDQQSEEGKKWDKTVNTAIDFISYLQGASHPLDLARRVRINPKLTEFLASEEFFDYFADNVNMDYGQYSEAINLLQDAARISSAYDTFNTRLAEYYKNPMSVIENREKIDKKKETANKAQNNSRRRNDVQNSTVNNLVQQAQQGEVDLDELSSMFTDENLEFLNNMTEEQQQTSKDKVNEAKKIIDTKNQVSSILNDLDNKEEVNEQTVQDAQTLLNNSMGVSNSTQEMLDTATQAYLDPNVLFDTLDPTIQELANTNPGELEAILDARLDAARTLIEEATSILENEKELREKLPSKEDVVTQRTLGEGILETGHDSTEKGISENDREKNVLKEQEEKNNSLEQKKKDIINKIHNDLFLDPEKISNVLTFIDELGTDNLEDIINELHNNDVYKELLNALPSEASKKKLGSYITKYIFDKSSKKDTTKQESTQEEGVEENIEEDIEEGDSYEPIFSYELDELTDEEFNRNMNNSDVNDVNLSAPEYYFWKPTSSRLPIHPIKGYTTPFYLTQQAKKYPASVQQRLKAVWEYLNKRGAFDRLDTGKVKAGDKIYFIIDPTLNEDAGETVILMAVKEGDEYHPIGELGSKNDVVTGRQKGIIDFIKYAEEQWEKSDKQSLFVLPQTSTVAKNMVGKVPYTAVKTRDTFISILKPLNDIAKIQTSTGESIRVPFTLGIALENGANSAIRIDAGRKKKDGLSAREATVISPLNAKAGQPYLLLPTSNSKRAYMPVPIMTFKVDLNENNSFNQEIIKLLNRLPSIKEDKEAMLIADALKELLSVENIYIELSDDNTIKIRLKKYGSNNYKSLNSLPKDDTLVTKIKDFINDATVNYRINRKYINGKYNGIDYNNMVGEIAYTNLPEGTTHTVSEWITINPIVDGEEQTAKSPKSTRFNPGHVDKTTQLNFSNGKIVEYNMDKDELALIKEDGSKQILPREDKKYNKYRAQAWGSLTNQDFSKPFKSPWGWYNHKTNSFIEEQTKSTPIRELDVTEESKNPTDPNKEVPVYNESIEAEAKERGLLGTEVNKKVWEVLSNEDKALIVNKPAIVSRNLMNKLAKEYSDNPNDFEREIHSILRGTKYRQGPDKGYKPINIEKEKRWLRKVLPQLNNDELLKVVNGLISIPNSAKKAYGMFKEGVITLADNGARGTLYHEAFHSVAHTLLTAKEFDRMLQAGKDKYNTIDDTETEELLAEDFRRYVQREEGFKGKFVRFFRYLKHIIQSLRGKELYLDNLYYRINRGKLADRAIHKTTASRLANAYTEEMEDIKRKAIADGTFMKAPNGNPTNLNERQWLQVRTKAFKEWFGDWINDPEHASKVVDENGEPLVVYHDGAYEINVFKGDSYGLSYFGDPATATTYGGSEYAVFLNIKKPQIVEGEGKEIGDITEEKYGIRRVSPKNNQDGVIYKNVKDIGEGIYDWDADEVDAFWVHYEKQGYGTVYAIPNPNQIKSATDNVGTFSTTNNDIRYRTADDVFPLETVEDFQRTLDSTINNDEAYYTEKARNNDLGRFKDFWEDKGFIVKTRKNRKTKRVNVISVTKIDDSYSKIEQYHRDKYAIRNLSASDLQYLKERNISLDEYSKMSPDMREILFKCKS